jgi:asparagine synthase (glutamine-hydrolysing)
MKLRWFFKRAMRDFLPKEVLSKTKHGFGLPFGVWLKTDLKLQQFTYDSLAVLKSYAYFRRGFIDELIDTHRRGHAAFYGSMIWVLMALAIWLRTHDGVSATR